MLSLDTLQRTVARSVLCGNNFGLAPLLEAGQSDPYGRLRIYQNNTRASLTATLEAVFPVTVKLVDERFFRYAASEFVRRHPPREPRLSRYGGDFPGFLRAFDGLEDMPFVAATARLEWAIAEALHISARPACTLADLGKADPEAMPELILQPSLRMVVSRWPALSIWSAHQGGEPMQVDASQRHLERTALWRSGESVRFARLPAAHFAFCYTLKAGLGLEKAVTRALVHDPMFDVLGALVGLFRDGLVAHVRLETTPRN